MPNSLPRRSFRTCKKEKGVPFRLPIPRVRDIITGSVKLPGHRAGLPNKVITIGKPPALPGDSQGLTVPGIYESLLNL